MWMLEYDRWLELTCKLSHLLASLPSDSVWRLVRLASGTEHVQVMAAKNEYPLVGNLQQMSAEIDNLHQVAFLVARWVGLPRPEAASAGEFVNRHQLGMFLAVISGKINSDCQDVNLPFGCPEYSF